MAYTEINARRELAKRLFEIQHGDRGHTWVAAHPEIKRGYEAHVEKLLDPSEPDVRDALAAIGFGCDACT